MAPRLPSYADNIGQSFWRHMIHQEEARQLEFFRRRYEPHDDEEDLWIEFKARGQSDAEKQFHYKPYLVAISHRSAPATDILLDVRQHRPYIRPSKDEATSPLHSPSVVTEEDNLSLPLSTPRPLSTRGSARPSLTSSRSHRCPSDDAGSHGDEMGVLEEGGEEEAEQNTGEGNEGSIRAKTQTPGENAVPLPPSTPRTPIASPRSLSFGRRTVRSLEETAVKKAEGKATTPKLPPLGSPRRKLMTASSSRSSASTPRSRTAASHQGSSRGDVWSRGNVVGSPRSRGSPRSPRNNPRRGGGVSESGEFVVSERPMSLCPLLHSPRAISGDLPRTPVMQRTPISGVRTVESVAAELLGSA